MEFDKKDELKELFPDRVKEDPRSLLDRAREEYVTDQKPLEEVAFEATEAALIGAVTGDVSGEMLREWIDDLREFEEDREKEVERDLPQEGMVSDFQADSDLAFGMAVPEPAADDDYFFSAVGRKAKPGTDDEDGGGGGGGGGGGDGTGEGEGDGDGGSGDQPDKPEDDKAASSRRGDKGKADKGKPADKGKDKTKGKADDKGRAPPAKSGKGDPGSR